MKKILTSAMAFMVFSAAFSQACPANDSTSMGSGSGNDVYYSLKKARTTGNGVVKTVANNNWHLAVSVQFSEFPNNPANGVAIRVNSTLGENPQAGLTGTKLVRLNGANPANWRSVDTTGLHALPELIDSDSTWNLSAFTKGYPSQGPFNFIWGSYNQNNHNVESNGHVYVLYNKSANWYKKIHVKELSYDTLWHIIISNIDNTDSVYLNINKKDYSKRMFVYYNVLTNTLNDREPDNDQWDLLWTKYKGMVDFMGGKVPYSVTGVLHNKRVTSAKNLGKKCNEVWLSNKTASFQNNISTIGHDWKTFTGTAYAITDTFVYFVNARDSQTYKITMKGFAGGPLGKTTFNFYQATLATEEVNLAPSLMIYPNPAGSVIHLGSENPVLSAEIFSTEGRSVLRTDASTIDVSSLSPGIYTLLVRTPEGAVRKSFIKE